MHKGTYKEKATKNEVRHGRKKEHGQDLPSLDCNYIY